MLLYNYVDAPNSNLLCCICRAPFTDPVTTTTCQHTFCRDCITRALSHAPQCPVDRLPLNESDLGSVNPIVRSLVDELLVECPYKDGGCRATVQRQSLAAHLKEECRHSESGRVRCEADDVDGKSEALDSDGSTKVSKSPQPSSSPKPTPGVQLSTPQREGDNGRTSSPTPSRVSILTEQNILLRRRVDTLEGAIQTLKKEMSAVRTVLSPWFQNASNSGSAGPSRLPAPQILRGGLGINGMPSTAERQASAQRTGINETNLGADAASADLDHDDLASYFPAEDEVRVRRPSPQNPQSPPENVQTQRQRPPGMGHLPHHSLSSLADPPLPLGALGYFGAAHSVGSPMGAFYGSSNSVLSPPSGVQYGMSQIAASQPISIPVPELDVKSQSLATTLHGLHSGIVSLASTIEDIHKKSDLALALMGGGTGAALPGGGVVGEVLRLGEEVMGVRATVQGLRMQMHGLMMGNVAGVGGLNLGFGRSQPPTNVAAASGGEEGAADGHYSFSPAPVLQNQRMFYPGATPGITKL